MPEVRRERQDILRLDKSIGIYTYLYLCLNIYIYRYLYVSFRKAHGRGTLHPRPPLIRVQLFPFLPQILSCCPSLEV